MILEIFRTNVSSAKQAEVLLKSLQLILSDCIMNFDLEDVDKILRIEAHRDVTHQVVRLVTAKGFLCERL